MNKIDEVFEHESEVRARRTRYVGDAFAYGKRSKEADKCQKRLSAASQKNSKSISSRQSKVTKKPVSLAKTRFDG